MVKSLFALCVCVLVGSSARSADLGSPLPIPERVAKLEEGQAALLARVVALEQRAKVDTTAPKGGLMLADGTRCPCPNCPFNTDPSMRALGLHCPCPDCPSNSTAAAKTSFLNPPVGAVRVCDENGCRYVMPATSTAVTYGTPYTLTADQYTAYAAGGCATGNCGTSAMYGSAPQSYDASAGGGCGASVGAGTHKHPVIWRILHPFKRQ